MAARRMVGLVLVLVALFGVAGAYSSAFGGAVRESPDHNRIEIENESVSVSQDSLITLAESNNKSRYYFENDSVTIYNNSSVVRQGGNYTWFKENATFRTDPNTETLNNTTANVTYGYFLPSKEQRLAREITLFAPNQADTVGIALGAAVLLAGLAYASNSRP